MSSVKLSINIPLFPASLPLDNQIEHSIRRVLVSLPLSVTEEIRINISGNLERKGFRVIETEKIPQK